MEKKLHYEDLEEQNLFSFSKIWEDPIVAKLKFSSWGIKWQYCFIKHLDDWIDETLDKILKKKNLYVRIQITKFGGHKPSILEVVGVYWPDDECLPQCCSQK